MVTGPEPEQVEEGRVLRLRYPASPQNSPAYSMKGRSRRMRAKRRAANSIAAEGEKQKTKTSQKREETKTGGNGTEVTV